MYMCISTVHSCSSCSKTFKRPCDLHRHELTHSGSKHVYMCTVVGCSKSYDRVATLRKHIKAQHHGELPYKCEHCVAAFPYHVSSVHLSTTLLMLLHRMSFRDTTLSTCWLNVFSLD